MRIVVIGGTGLIGSRLVPTLREYGYVAVAASRRSGVDTFLGDVLAEALQGAAAVVDVSNSSSPDATEAMEFFTTSTRNLLAAEAQAGVRHHVALSVVGTERLQESGYMRAKMKQETLIRESSIPYSIVRATQFFEMMKRIAAAATVGDTIRLAPVLFQPMAANEVARALGKVAVGEPLNGILEIAGPEQFRLDLFVRDALKAHQDPREVILDPESRYFGARLSERSLVPAEGAQLGEMRFQDWLRQPVLQP